MLQPDQPVPGHLLPVKIGNFVLEGMGALDTWQGANDRVP